MEERYRELLDQMVQMAEEGKFGDSIRSSRREYARLRGGIAVFVKCVLDAYAPKKGTTSEILSLRDEFTRAILIAYRDSVDCSSKTAEALIQSIIRDYPGVPGSCLLPQFNTLAQAALGFREVAYSSNRTVLWQQMSGSFLSYNEFLNALLGFLLPCIECSYGKAPDKRVFSLSYGAKLKRLRDATGGTDETSSLIFRLARPKIRNGLAHGTAWLNSAKARVYYTDVRSGGRKQSISLADFGALALVGSHLAEPYLAGIGAVVVIEEGTDFARSLLPKHLLEEYRRR